VVAVGATTPAGQPNSWATRHWKEGQLAEREGFVFALFSQVLVTRTHSNSTQCLRGSQAHSEFTLLFPQFL